MAFRRMSVVFIGLAAVGANAGAQQATQVVHFQVNAVNQLAVTGNPAPMIVNSAIAGSGPTSVIGAGTSYAISTNEINQMSGKISVNSSPP